MALVNNQPTSELRQLVAHLKGTWHGTVAMCRCPAHQDRTPSLSIRQGDRGILVTCHAGCDSVTVLRELSRIAALPDFRPEDVKPAPRKSGSPHLAIWKSAIPIEGTIAETYIRETRNIWAPLNDVRFHPRCPKGKGKDLTRSRDTLDSGPTDPKASQYRQKEQEIPRVAELHL